jgi:hypothetical protein
MRLMIYQIIILWASIRLNKIEQTSDEIKEKLKRNYMYFNIPKNQTILDFIEDPSLFVLIWCVLEIIFGILGLFGSTFGNKVSAFLFSITTIIYFNPLLPENLVNLYDIRIELFFNIGILLGMLLCAYQPIPEDAFEEYTNDEIKFMVDKTRASTKNYDDTGKRKTNKVTPKLRRNE